jgi:hypothetical protein
MKKIMIALAILGMVYSGAEAQTRTCHSSAKKLTTHKVAHLNRRTHTGGLAKTYQVCREQGGYYVCCVYNKNVATSWK